VIEALVWTGVVALWVWAIYKTLMAVSEWGRYARWAVLTHPGEERSVVRGRYRWLWVAERVQLRMNTGNEPDDAPWFLVPVQPPKVRFASLVVAGLVPLSAIEDWVERWHEGGGFGLELHEYLGLSEEEYEWWVQDPEMLVVAFRRRIRKSR